MKNFFPILLIIFITVLFFNPFLFLQLLPIPSDTIVGLYSPYRDFYVKSYPRGIPFKNFLITDPVRQQYPWRYLAVNLEKKLQLPLWNPYTFAGTPLLANFQSASLYPLNILLFVFPFSFGWSLMVFLEPILGGIFMYYYLRNLKLNFLSSIIGGIIFIYSGFSVAWMEWNTILQVTLWVPLVLLAEDKLLERWNIQWTLILFFSECSAILAGHIQLLFYALCIINVYLLTRAYQKTLETGQKHRLIRYIKICAPFLILGICVCIITSVQWVPTLEFINQSARGMNQINWQQPGWFVPWQNLVQLIAPDFFGNPATLNYFGVWNYAELVVYIGILPIILAIFALIFRHDRKTFFFGTLLFIALIFSLPTPIAKIPFIFHVPLFSTSQPTRLIFVIDFSLAILAALGLEFFMRKKKKEIFWIIGFFWAFFLGIWTIILKVPLFYLQFSHNQISIIRRNLVFPTLIFVISSIVIYLLFTLSNKLKYLIPLLWSLLLFIVVVDLYRFNQKFTPFTNPKYLFPQTSAINFLEHHLGYYRYMTTNSQILPPNFSVMYKLQTIDGYDPLYLKNYGEFIAATERDNPNINPPFGFNRIITPKRYKSPFINLLGVKYILSLSDIQNSNFKKVFQEGDTRIYENKQVLPRVFFARNVISVRNNKNAINMLFKNKEHLDRVAVVQSNLNFHTSMFGSANIVNYSENRIVIKTQNKEPGFLVLTDSYYPSWDVRVDGIPTTIFLTDFDLRGVIVSAGVHTVEFKDQLL